MNIYKHIIVTKNGKKNVLKNICENINKMYLTMTKELNNVDKWYTYSSLVSSYEHVYAMKDIKNLNHTRISEYRKGSSMSVSLSVHPRTFLYDGWLDFLHLGYNDQEPWFTDTCILELAMSQI